MAAQCKDSSALVVRISWALISPEMVTKLAAFEQTLQGIGFAH